MHFWFHRHQKRCGPEANTVLKHVPEGQIFDEIEEESDIDECIAGIAQILAEKGGKWILKASTGNAGEDLVVFDDVTEVQELLKKRGINNIWVVQKYIERPLLLRGRKVASHMCLVFAHMWLDLAVFPLVSPSSTCRRRRGS